MQSRQQSADPMADGKQLNFSDNVPEKFHFVQFLVYLKEDPVD